MNLNPGSEAAETGIERYARAHGMLERLEDRVSFSPVRRSLAARIKLAEIEALSWVDDASLTGDDFIIDRRGRIGFSEFSLLRWRSALSEEISLKELEHDPDAILR